MEKEFKFSSEENKDIKSESLIISKREMQEFIKMREIDSEDFPLIEKLASFNKNLLIAGLHNMFNLSKEGSVKTLEHLISLDNNAAERKELYQIALEFAKKYGWITSHHLIGVLEKLK